jgi:hypothetical protein
VQDKAPLIRKMHDELRKEYEEQLLSVNVAANMELSEMREYV